MGDRKHVPLCTSSAQKEPPGKPFLDGMFRITSCKLCRLNQLCLDMPERELMKPAAHLKLFRRRLQRATVTLPRNLDINPVQAVSSSHQSCDSNHRVVTIRSCFNLGAVLERSY